MKLHLPKGLLAAVIAAFALSQTVWAGELVDGTYTTTAGAQGDVDMTTTTTTATTQYITPGSGVDGSVIGTLKMDAGDTINVRGTESDNFSSLTIGGVEVNGTGQATLGVLSDQHVNLQGSSGELCFSIEESASLTLSGSHTRLDARQGVAIVESGVVSIGTLDSGMGGNARGGILVKEGASLSVTTLYNHVNNTTKVFTLEKDATLTLGSVTVKGISSDSTKYATIHRTSGGGEYSVSNGSYVIANAQVEYNGTLSNILTNVVLNSDTEGNTLTVSNSANTISKVTASTGTINVQNAARVGAVEMTGGAVAISGSTVQDATLSIIGGTLSINNSTMMGDVTIDAANTIGITITDAKLAGHINNEAGADKLTVAGTWTIDDLSQLTAKDGSSSFVLDSDQLDATNDERNGFVVSSGGFWVVEGAATLAEGATLTHATGTSFDMISDDSGIYFETDSSVDKSKYYVTVGTVAVSSDLGADSYVVRGGTMSISGTMNASDINYTSGGITLADANATLVLDSADNAAQLLSVTTGEAGTIKVTTNTTMAGAAQAKGNLTVEGATLTVELPKVNNNNGPNKNENNWLSSFNSIDLNDAIVKYHGSKTTWKNVTVGADGAIIKIKDMDTGTTTPLPDKFLTLDGTTTLDGALTIESSWDTSQTWKYGVNIKALTGTGDLTIKGTQSPNSSNEYNYVMAKLEDSYTGSIAVQHGTGSLTKLTLSAEGDINLKGLTLSGGEKAQVDLSGVKGTKNLGAVSVGQGSKLNLQGTIGTMTASGDGVITLAEGTTFTGTASIANAISDISDTAKSKLVVADRGNLTINSSNNTYSGGTEVKGGATLAVAGQTTNALGSGVVDVKEKSTLKLGWLSSLEVDTINLSGESIIDLENASSRELSSLNTLSAAINIEGSNTIKAGKNGDNAAITGTIKGNGTLNLDNKGDFGNTWLLQSTISDKSDTEKLAISSNSNAIVSGTNTYTGGTTITGRTLTTTSEKALGEGTVTVKGGTLKQDGSALSVTALDYQSGTVNNNGQALEVGTLTVGSTNKLEMQGSGTTTVTDKLVVSKTDAFSMEGALVLTDATVDLSGFTLDTTTPQDTYVYTLGTAAGGITAGESITFSGLNVDGYTATLAAVAADPTAGAVMMTDGTATNNYLVLTLTKDQTPDTPTTLTEVTVSNGSYADAVLTLTTNVADAANVVFGDKLNAVIEDGLWEQLVKDNNIGTLVDVALTDVNGNYIDLDGDGTSRVELTINGIGVNPVSSNHYGTAGSGDAAVNGAVVGSYVTAYIPEPTTTTLSLLALAALAARRRRR